MVCIEFEAAQPGTFKQLKKNHHGIISTVYMTAIGHSEEYLVCQQRPSCKYASSKMQLLLTPE